MESFIMYIAHNKATFMIYLERRMGTNNNHCAINVYKELYLYLPHISGELIIVSYGSIPSLTSFCDYIVVCLMCRQCYVHK